MSKPTEMDPPERWADFPNLGRVCRLGLATRGNCQLSADDVLLAVEHGINYLNWCGVGHDDGMVEAVRSLGTRRKDVFIAAQFFARTVNEAREELDEILHTLKTDYVDVLTYYYVEQDDEWDEIVAPGGAAEFLNAAKADGVVRSIGLTSHQRGLAAHIPASGAVDMLMIRYNAAHRGAETEIFPVTRRLDLPVVTYTALRWGALLRATPDDPAEFRVPNPVEAYRFALMNPDVTVCVMAPQTSEQLLKNLELVTDWRGLSETRYGEICEHGNRVHSHGGAFP